MARGGGKRTARSQRHRQQQNDALRKYGYPSMRELRREAQGLAGASVPTVREVKRPYTRQIQSSKEYLAAVRAALAETQSQVGADYSQAVDQSQGVTDAAQARLSALGLGVDQAGTQASVGARGDSATQNLIANAASARGYAATLPAIASGQATQFADVTRNKMLDALSSRRDQLSQAFFQALQQVQGNALQRAQFNMSSDQFGQQMAQSASQFAAQMAQSRADNAQSQANADRSFNEGVREFNLSRKDQKAAASAAGISDSEWRQQAKIVMGATAGTPAETARIPQYGPNGHVISYKIKTIAPAGPNAAEQGQHFDTVLRDLTQQGVSLQVALPMLKSLYTTPHIRKAPRYIEDKNGQVIGISAEWLAYQSYLKFIDPLYGHHPYEGEHGQQYGGR